MGDIAVATEPIEIRAAGVGTDKVGNTVPTWATWTSVPSRAYVEEQQSTTTNKSTRRRQTVTRYLVIFDHEAAVSTETRLWWPRRSMWLHVDGRPRFPQDPDGMVNHTEVMCVEGLG